MLSRMDRTIRQDHTSVFSCPSCLSRYTSADSKRYGSRIKFECSSANRTDTNRIDFRRSDVFLSSSPLSLSFSGWCITSSIVLIDFLFLYNIYSIFVCPFFIWFLSINVCCLDWMTSDWPTNQPTDHQTSFSTSPWEGRRCFTRSI